MEVMAYVIWPLPNTQKKILQKYFFVYRESVQR